eukprot:jgi/Galph1/1741/GphlegSOOS_G399.1
MTHIWEGDNELDVYEAAQALKNGRLVAFPTETVYGLGANAYDEKAVSGVFLAKGRPQDNPLIVHISNFQILDELVEAPLPPAAQLLMHQFWPGPLSLVLKLKKDSRLVKAVTGGQENVAIRMPSHPVALALLVASQVPVAAPSANSSGRPSPTSALHVLADLNGKIDGVVDGGETCGIGLESTVLDCTTEKLRILRPGAITAEQIEQVAQQTVEFAVYREPSGEENRVPLAPGMKYRHYAPVAPVDICKGDLHSLQQRIAEWKSLGKKVGIMACKEYCKHIEADVVVSYGTQSCMESYARELYAALRAFDESSIHVDVIVAQAVEEKGIGVAIMNRLRKAASSGMYEAVPHISK